MKDTLTLQLAKEILFLQKNPIPKVRLAKIIYFSFKELVRLGLYKREDMTFIRMPLGPVPLGFNQIAQDKDVEVVIASVGLSYNRENYSLKKDVKLSGDYSQLSKILERLNQYPTSTLIEMSHKDASWLNHENSNEYYIELEDLRPLTAKTVPTLSTVIDDQLIQSKLVKGMKEDIVKDNSALEYPDYYSKKNG